jgi:hypothetical protein
MKMVIIMIESALQLYICGGYFTMVVPACGQRSALALG